MPGTWAEMWSDSWEIAELRFLYPHSDPWCRISLESFFSQNLSYKGKEIGQNDFKISSYLFSPVETADQLIKKGEIYRENFQENRLQGVTRIANPHSICRVMPGKHSLLGTKTWKMFQQRTVIAVMISSPSPFNAKLIKMRLPEPVDFTVSFEAVAARGIE